MTDHACRHVARDQPRLLRSHTPGCDTSSCPGCQPCPERHCRLCRREHVTIDGRGTDHTCGTCLGQTRTNLKSLWKLSAELLGEALVRGIHSQAAMLIAPNADPETYHRRAILIAKAAAYADAKTPAAARLDALMDDVHDEPHPGWVLRDWERQIRIHLDQATDAASTLTDAHDYINDHLTRLAHDPHFAFDEMARELQRCHDHVEEVLRAGEQIERGAPCQTCRRPLERHTDDEGRVTFECTRCHETLTENQYRLAVRAEHIAQADRLNADDMAERVGVPASTIRRWANIRRIQHAGQDPVEHPPLLRSCGVDGKGRKVYRVSEVERIRDNGGDTRGRVVAASGTERVECGTVSNEGAA